MNLTLGHSMANTLPVSAKSLAGISLPFIQAPRRFLKRLFCACYFFMASRMEALRCAASWSGKANSVRFATNSRLASGGGDFKPLSKVNIMSIPTVTAQIRSAVGFIDPAQLEITDLPFVKDKPGPSGRLFWDVKPNGNYGDECLIGKSYALDALQYMLSQDYTPLLPWIVADMPGRDARSGIEVGFLSTIASYAAYGVAAFDGREE